MDKIGLLAFVRPFYRKTLGFWASILIVGGVLMEGRQHVLLGRFFFKNPLTFWILPIAILVFGWIHLNIQRQLIRRYDYQVFHQLGLFTKKDFGLFWSRILLANFSPFLGYFLFLSYFAWEQHAIIQGIILWMFIFSILLVNYWGIWKILSKALKEPKIYRPHIPWVFPRFTWILLSLRQERPILLLLTKGLSLLLMNGFLFTFQSGHYDFRWLQFGILCISYLQLPIILDKTESEIQTQTWVLALPIRLTDKIVYQLGSLVLLVLPELIFILWKGLNSNELIEYLILMIFLLLFLLALQAVIYRNPGSTRLPNFLGGMFFLFFLGIVFGISWIAFFFLISLFFLNQIRSAYHF